MPFVEKILPYRSLSIVGMEKNTGKTVCLNYLLRRLHERGVAVAVTSIGIDGEQVDSVYATAKPEITLYEGTHFITSEQHYRQRRLVSRIVDVDRQHTALGSLVTAEVLCRGKVILSGAATTEKLRRQIDELEARGIPLTLVDGALSRLSLASPTITDAMVLATGAAVSVNLQQLVSKTRFVCSLVRLPAVEPTLRDKLSRLTSGVWCIDDDGVCHDTGFASALLVGSHVADLFRQGRRLFLSGVLSDRLLQQIATLPHVEEITLIARDFTKLFITPETYANYHRRGGQLAVLQQSQLTAVCFNPTSPQGFRLDSQRACATLSEALGLPVYDVKMI